MGWDLSVFFFRRVCLGLVGFDASREKTQRNPGGGVQEGRAFGLDKDRLLLWCVT